MKGGALISSKTKDHPAKYSQPVLDALTASLQERLPSGAKILDPFAGVGGIHALYPTYETYGVEIEPEWANAHSRTLCADSRFLLEEFDPGMDAIITSPAYGNRMADRYAGDARGTKRYTYRTSLGRSLHEANAGQYNWSGKDRQKYIEIHRRVWANCYILLRSGGYFMLNVSNHIRSSEEMPVVEWHMKELLDNGFLVDEVYSVQTARMRHGANNKDRVASEKILILRKS